MYKVRNLSMVVRHLVSTLFIVALTIALSAKLAHADVTLFTDRASFNAAAANLTNIDFEGLIPSPSGFTYYPNGLTQKNVTFRSVGCDLYVTGPQYPDGYYQWNSGAVLTYQHSSTNVLQVDLPDGVTAVGSDIMNILSTGDPVTVVLATGETYNVPTSPEPNRAFMGVVASQPIKSLSFSSMSYGLIDNFVFGQNAYAKSKVVKYTDKASFLSMLQDSTNVDFEGIAPTSSFREFGTSDGLWLDGVNFVGVPNSIVRGFPYGEAVVDPAFYRPYYDWGSGAVLNGSYSNGHGGTIYVTLPGGVNAVGGDLMTFLPYGSTLHVTLSTGDSVDVPTNNFPGRAFVGFISSIPIKTISFSSPYGTEINLDNFVFGHVKPLVTQAELGLPQFVTDAGGRRFLSVRLYLKGYNAPQIAGRWLLDGRVQSTMPSKQLNLSPDTWQEATELQIDLIGNHTLQFAVDASTIQTEVLQSSFTGFRPDLNGWGFSNKLFGLDPLPPIKRQGQCLGMTSLARWYYVRNQALPTWWSFRKAFTEIVKFQAEAKPFLLNDRTRLMNNNYKTIGEILTSQAQAVGNRLQHLDPCVVGIDGLNPNLVAGHAALLTAGFYCPILYDAARGEDVANTRLFSMYDPNVPKEDRYFYVYDASADTHIRYIPDDAFYRQYDYFFEYTGQK